MGVNCNIYRKIFIFWILFALFIGSVMGETSIRLRGKHVGRLASRAFEVIDNTDLRINGRGVLVRRPGRDIITYSWIIDTDSKEVIWNSIDSQRNYYKDDGEFRIRDEIRLNRGTYKLYFINTYEENGFEDTEHFDLGEFLGEVLKGIKNKDIDYYRLYLELEAEDSELDLKVEPHLIDQDRFPVVSFWEVNENEYKKEQFSLDKDTKLKIHYTGERKNGDDYDYARIYALETHKIVWPDNQTQYTHAGGGEKNVEAIQTITLPQGNYEVSYVTDGSHSFNNWNTLPPKEPEMWGISISCDNSDRRNLTKKTVDYEPLVDLRGAGNNDNISQGFEINQDVDLRVICIGEYLGEPYDYGWIEEAKTHQRIWEFNEDNTVHAGGDQKNRKFNDIIHFEKGKYILHYVSDDSHSYLSWNEAPPYEQDLWGISVWPVNEKDSRYVSLFDEEKLEEQNLIVEIAKVGNSREVHEDFKIEKSGKYRIYALGEGEEHRMFDTGWIKNMGNGIIVWEMTYRKTKHAGGAWKNRLYNGPVYLEEGNYRVYFKTDGSHSYHAWNAAPPRNQEDYGIKIYSVPLIP